MERRAGWKKADDSISRAGTIDAIEKAMCEDGFRSSTGLIHKTTVYEIIRHLPSAQPEIKTDGDTISRQDAIDAIHCDITVTGRQNAELVSETIATFVDRIKALPSAQPDNRIAKIADLVEGTIDHFELDDAMDLIYQIKEILGDETSNIRG